jgi:hypothetical protein
MFAHNPAGSSACVIMPRRMLCGRYEQLPLATAADAVRAAEQQQPGGHFAAMTFTGVADEQTVTLPEIGAHIMQRSTVLPVHTAWCCAGPRHVHVTCTLPPTCRC